ncbi:MAG: efflux RND transporter periplasmic adaptor subunit [Ginsengibacter sp.]|jgi:membrane fusion protein (multidrug efflux system)
MKKNTKINYLALLALSLSLVIISCGNKKSNSSSQTTITKEYEVFTISAQPFTISSEFPATIEGQQNIEIRPKIDGFIEKIYVDEGATVRKGQILFKINAPQYEQGVRTAQANIQIAQANVNAARMEVNKVRPLVEKKIISQYELQTAEYNLQSKEAALAQANAALANARTNLGYTTITSPVNGIIGSLPFKIGSLVSSSTPQPLTTVSNVGNIYAYFSVNEKTALDFENYTKGNTSKEKLAMLPPVTLILSNGTEFPQKGKIETSGGMVNTETGSLSLRATFANPGNIVKSGSSGLIRIPTKLKDALLIPQKSTFEIQGKKFVYLVQDSGKVKSTPIKIRENSGGQFFVVEEGLKPGDVIVYEGVASLREGEMIKPNKLDSDSLFKTNVQ